MILDFDAIRADLSGYQARLKAKGYEGDIEAILEQEEEYRGLLSEVNELRAERNAAAKSKDIEKGKELKEKLQAKEARLSILEEELKQAELRVPNTPMEGVPAGGEENNRVVETVGDIPAASFELKDHVALGTELDMLDLETAADISGARFYFLKNEAVQMQMALEQWVTERLLAEGFQLMTVPHLVKEETMHAAGFLPGGEEEMFFDQRDGLYLIGTSEQSLAGYFKDKILSESELPTRKLAISSCYRREAGAHGRDTKGIIRVHQFEKMEMFSVTKPEASEAEHELMVSITEGLLDSLKLPYQKVLLAAGDASKASAKTFDLEVWLPSQGRYLEVASISNTTDYQARRGQMRYRPEGAKETAYVHSLNGTALAVTRMLVVIWENYQTAEGGITVPEVLKPYLPFTEITKK